MILLETDLEFQSAVHQVKFLRRKFTYWHLNERLNQDIVFIKDLLFPPDGKIKEPQIAITF